MVTGMSYLKNYTNSADLFETTVRDGRYDCVDMDITKTDKESGIRPVNILTIKWLIFNGVKYIVE